MKVSIKMLDGSFYMTYITDQKVKEILSKVLKRQNQNEAYAGYGTVDTSLQLEGDLNINLQTVENYK